MKVAIIGLGLIGGSIGLALKNAVDHIEVIGIPHREITIAEAIERNAIDWGTTDLAKGVKEADIVFICTPIHLIVPKIEEIKDLIKPGAIITDVGSSKEQIVHRADRIMSPQTYFVGGHPMAGKEKVKFHAAEYDLFNGQLYVLTPTSKTNRQALEKVKEVIGYLDCRVIELDPKQHDLCVAAISHMPLAVAASLVETIINQKKGQDEMKACAASGFRDTTRIASGDPVLGKDMFTSNKEAVLEMIGYFKRTLGDLERLIRSGNAERIEAELKKIKDFRDSIYG